MISTTVMECHSNDISLDATQILHSTHTRFHTQAKYELQASPGPLSPRQGTAAVPHGGEVAGG